MKIANARTGSWTGSPREKRAPRVGISSTVFGVRAQGVRHNASGAGRLEIDLRFEDIQEEEAQEEEEKPIPSEILRRATPSTRAFVLGHSPIGSARRARSNLETSDVSDL